jgi:hypothetical protein
MALEDSPMSMLHSPPASFLWENVPLPFLSIHSFALSYAHGWIFLRLQVSAQS